jgi:hypothetical protein
MSGLPGILVHGPDRRGRTRLGRRLADQLGADARVLPRAGRTSPDELLAALARTPGLPAEVAASWRTCVSRGPHACPQPPGASDACCCSRTSSTT